MTNRGYAYDRAALWKDSFNYGCRPRIGRAFAKAYVQEGAKVAICDVNIERAKITAQEIGDSAIAIDMDVTCQNSIDDAIANVVSQFGRIDILINNAAVFTAAPITELIE